MSTRFSTRPYLMKSTRMTTWSKSSSSVYKWPSNSTTTSNQRPLLTCPSHLRLCSTHPVSTTSRASACSRRPPSSRSSPSPCIIPSKHLPHSATIRCRATHNNSSTPTSPLTAALPILSNSRFKRRSRHRL